MAYKKFVRQFQIQQKNKASEKPKYVKESNNSLLRNYWNKTKYIWLNNRKIEEKDELHSKE